MPIENKFEIDVDIKQYTAIKIPTVTQNDTVGFIFRVYDEGRIYNIQSGTTFTLNSTRPDKQTVMTVGNVVGENIVQFTLGSNEIAVKGKVEAVIQVYDANGRVSTIPFNYNVLNDPSTDYVPSTQDQTLIQQVLGDGPQILTDAETATTNANNGANSANTAATNANTVANDVSGAESLRVTAENTRVTSENTRETNEATRQLNESTRVTNESTRETNESMRQANETQRQSDFTTAITNAESATTSANTSANNAQNLVDTSVHLREYDPIVRYVKNNEVRYQGSTWRCLQDCLGISPIEGLSWTLVALKGVDGTGAVSTVNGVSPNVIGDVTLTASDVGAATPTDVTNVDNKIGLLSSLNTTEKTNIVSSINEVEQELTSHSAQKVHQGEQHGLRATSGDLEFLNGTEWKKVKGGSSFAVGNVSNFSAASGNGQVTLKWNDPTDLMADGVTLARWKGTKVLRKVGSFPANENDGVLVVDSGVRNQYATNGFVDIGLVNGTVYYYMAFPYTMDDVFTVDVANRVQVTPTPQKIYGVRVDKNNSNPETRVTYIGDAVGFTPMRGNNGSLQWGSWQNTDLLKDIKPCVLQNLGGSNAQVRYYLNPNNYAQKEDGTSAVITGADGDVMIEIPERYWKFTNEGTTYTVEVSDKPFSGAVKLAHEIENGYNQVPFYALLLTQCIMLILLKSTDTQIALGRGYVDGNSVYTSTGNTNTRGLFYGTTNGTQQMKFLGLEDYRGNKLWWIDGLFYNASRDMLIGLGNFSDTGSGYTNHGYSGFGADAGGYINAIQGGNNTGFIPRTISGSGTTFYADYGHVGGGRLPYFGGARAYGDIAGGFFLDSHTAAYSHVTIGARLCFKKGDKLYIGAYLGTVTGGRLRSISGTGEPTGSKTIGAFRTDARANNN